MVHGSFNQNPNGQWGTPDKFFIYSSPCPLKKYQLMLNLFQNTRTLTSIISSIYLIQHNIHTPWSDSLRRSIHQTPGRHLNRRMWDPSVYKWKRRCLPRMDQDLSTISLLWWNRQLNKLHPSTPSPSKTTAPVFDSIGPLHCGGRIHNATLDHSTKFPFKIPPTYPITNVIISDTHVKQLHSGVNVTITALRQSYWITYAPTWREITETLHDLPKTTRDSL